MHNIYLINCLLLIVIHKIYKTLGKDCFNGDPQINDLPSPEDFSKICSVPKEFERIAKSRFLAYKKSTTNANDAANICKKSNLTLANILTPEGQETVVNYMLSKNLESFWLGANDKEKVNIWVDSYQRPLKFSRFYEQEPDESIEVDRCAYMVNTQKVSKTKNETYRKNKALWVNMDCTKTKSTPLCEYPLYTPCRNLVDGVDSGNRGDIMERIRLSSPETPTKDSYYFSNFQKSWGGAIKYCQQAGLQSAIITQDEIDNLKAAIISANPNIPGKFWFFWTSAFSGALNYYNGAGQSFPKNKTRIPNSDKIFIQKNPCFNILIGHNEDELYGQYSNCELPLHFICKKPPNYDLEKTCETLTSYKLGENVIVPSLLELNFIEAQKCCRSMGLALLQSKIAKQNEKLLSNMLRNAGQFSLLDENESCTSVKVHINGSTTFQPCLSHQRFLCEKIPETYTERFLNFTLGKKEFLINFQEIDFPSALKWCSDKGSKIFNSKILDIDTNQPDFMTKFKESGLFWNDRVSAKGSCDCFEFFVKSNKFKQNKIDCYLKRKVVCVKDLLNYCYSGISTENTPESLDTSVDLSKACDFPEHFMRINSTRFLLQKKFVDGKVATEVCEKEKLKPANVESQSEHELIVEYMMSNKIDGIWLGVNSRGPNDMWVDSYKRPLKYSRFYELEPNNVTEEDYVILTVDNGAIDWPQTFRKNKALWNDIRWDRKTNSVPLCEFPLNSPCRKIIDGPKIENKISMREWLHLSSIETPSPDSFYFPNFQRSWDGVGEACAQAGLVPYEINSNDVESLRAAIITANPVAPGRFHHFWINAKGVVGKKELQNAKGNSVNVDKFETVWGSLYGAKTCAGIFVGNDVNKVYLQFQYCEIPQSFVCRRPQTFKTVEFCTKLVSFQIEGNIFVPRLIELPYEEAKTCCKYMNKKIADLKRIKANEDVIRNSLKTAGPFAMDDGNGGCTMLRVLKNGDIFYGPCIAQQRFLCASDAVQSDQNMHKKLTTSTKEFLITEFESSYIEAVNWCAEKGYEVLNYKDQSINDKILLRNLKDIGVFWSYKNSDNCDCLEFYVAIDSFFSNNVTCYIKRKIICVKDKVIEQNDEGNCYAGTKIDTIDYDGLYCQEFPNFKVISERSKFLFYSGGKTTGNAAVTTCKDAGLQIANIESLRDHFIVSNFIKESKIEDVWIGVNDYDGPGGKIFLDGRKRPLKYSLYDLKEPNEDINNGCTVESWKTNWKNLGFDSDSRWIHKSCLTEVANVICEYPQDSDCRLLTDKNKSKRLQEASSSIKPIPNSGKFYSSNFQKSWSEALKACERVGLHPAVLSDLNDLDVLRNNVHGEAYDYWIPVRISLPSVFIWHNKPENRLSFDLMETNKKEFENSSCVTFSKFNSGYHSQKKICELPNYFLCMKENEIDIEKVCGGSDLEFIDVEKGLFTPFSLHATFEQAQQCCKTQNLEVLKSSELSKYRTVLHQIYENTKSEIFAMSVNGSCEEIKFDANDNLVSNKCGDGSRHRIFCEGELKEPEIKTLKSGKNIYTLKYAGSTYQEAEEFCSSVGQTIIDVRNPLTHGLDLAKEVKDNGKFWQLKNESTCTCEQFWSQYENYQVAQKDCYKMIKTICYLSSPDDEVMPNNPMNETAENNSTKEGCYDGIQNEVIDYDRLSCKTYPNFTLIGKKSRFLYWDGGDKTWEEAFKICEEGGLQIANVESLKDHLALSKFSQENNIDEIWIGVRDYGTSEYKIMLDGKKRPLRYSLYDLHEPNEDFDGGCTVESWILNWKKYGFKSDSRWLIKNCVSDLAHVLCEYPEKAECRLIQNKDQYQKKSQASAFIKPIPNSDKFYSSNFQKSWGEAIKSCKDQGLQPAIIKNEDEFDEIKQNIASEVYDFWLPVKSEDSKVFHWHEAPANKMSFEFNDDGITKHETGSCVAISKFNNTIYSQRKLCDLPNYFLCMKEKEININEACGTALEFIDVSNGLYIPYALYASFNEAQKCCKAHNLSILTSEDIETHEYTLYWIYMSSNGGFFAQDGSSCYEAKFDSSGHVAKTKCSENSKLRVFCTGVLQPAPLKKITSGSNIYTINSTATTYLEAEQFCSSLNQDIIDIKDTDVLTKELAELVKDNGKFWVYKNLTTCRCEQFWSQHDSYQTSMRDCYKLTKTICWKSLHDSDNEYSDEVTTEENESNSHANNNDYDDLSTTEDYVILTVNPIDPDTLYDDDTSSTTKNNDFDSTTEGSDDKKSTPKNTHDSDETNDTKHTTKSHAHTETTTCHHEDTTTCHPVQTTTTCHHETTTTCHHETTTTTPCVHTTHKHHKHHKSTNETKTDVKSRKKRSLLESFIKIPQKVKKSEIVKDKRFRRKKSGKCKGKRGSRLKSNKSKRTRTSSTFLTLLNKKDETEISLIQNDIISSASPLESSINSYSSKNSYDVMSISRDYMLTNLSSSTPKIEAEKIIFNDKYMVSTTKIPDSTISTMLTTGKSDTLEISNIGRSIVLTTKKSDLESSNVLLKKSKDENMSVLHKSIAARSSEIIKVKNNERKIMRKSIGRNKKDIRNIRRSIMGRGVVKISQKVSERKNLGRNIIMDGDNPCKGIKFKTVLGRYFISKNMLIQKRASLCCQSQNRTLLSLDGYKTQIEHIYGAVSRDEQYFIYPNKTKYGTYKWRQGRPVSPDKWEVPPSGNENCSTFLLKNNLEMKIVESSCLIPRKFICQEFERDGEEYYNKTCSIGEFYHNASITKNVNVSENNVYLLNEQNRVLLRHAVHNFLNPSLNRHVYDGPRNGYELLFESFEIYKKIIPHSLPIHNFIDIVFEYYMKLNSLLSPARSELINEEDFSRIKSMLDTCKNSAPQLNPKLNECNNILYGADSDTFLCPDEDFSYNPFLHDPILHVTSNVIQTIANVCFEIVNPLSRRIFNKWNLALFDTLGSAAKKRLFHVTNVPQELWMRLLGPDYFQHTVLTDRLVDFVAEDNRENHGFVMRVNLLHFPKKLRLDGASDT